MTREESVSQIQGLFPADSQYSDTKERVQSLLAQAKRNVGFNDSWYNLPDHVLIEYAKLCIQEENRQTVNAFVKNYEW